MPAASDVEARVTVIGAVPLPLVGDTVMRVLPVPVLDAVQSIAVPAEIWLTITRCAGVLAPSVVPLEWTPPKFSAPRSSASPPPLGGGVVVGIVVETSADGALLRPEVFSA